MRFWSSPPHRDLEQTRILAGRDDRRRAAAQRRLRDRTRDGRVIGKAGCWRLPEIGFILHPHCWGQGLAAEACNAVIAHVFATYHLAAITADVNPRNEASLRLLGRLGFVETSRAAATYEIEGEISDSVYLALAAPLRAISQAAGDGTHRRGSLTQSDSPATCAMVTSADRSGSRTCPQRRCGARTPGGHCCNARRFEAAGLCSRKLCGIAARREGRSESRRSPRRTPNARTPNGRRRIAGRSGAVVLCSRKPPCTARPLRALRQRRRPAPRRSPRRA